MSVRVSAWVSVWVWVWGFGCECREAQRMCFLAAGESGERLPGPRRLPMHVQGGGA